MPNSRDEWFTVGLEACVGMWLQSYFNEMPLGLTHAQRKALDDYVHKSYKEAIDLDVEFPGWLPETVSEARLAELIVERAERLAQWEAERPERERQSIALMHWKSHVIREGGRRAHNSQATLPILVHVPHASTKIPDDDLLGFLAAPAAINAEIYQLTDHFTDELFWSKKTYVESLVFPVSRFLVDPERFDMDKYEPMAQKGMGVLYTHDTQGKQYRSKVRGAHRKALLDKYYRPHHKQMTQWVADNLVEQTRVLIIDAHSFPSTPLPCDEDQTAHRPDICIGTDAFHTPAWLTEMFVNHFESHGYRVEINRPYKGTIVPTKFYQKDARVLSIMVEINKGLYLDDSKLEPIKKPEAFQSLFDCIAALYYEIEIHTHGRELEKLMKGLPT